MEDQLTLENEKQPLKTRLQNQINDDGPTVTDVAKSMGFEVSANLATDFATGWLAPVAPLYAAINFASGLGANLIAQKIRGEKGFKFGEALASGGLATIPLMDPTLGRTATKLVGNPWSIQRAVVGGAGLGIAQRQLEAGIDEQRLISPTEAALSFGVGGAGGAGGKVIGDALGRKLINVIKGKPIDPYDPVNWTGKGTIAAQRTPINNGIDTGGSSPSIRVDPEFNSPIRAERFVPETSHRRGVVIRKQLEANLTMGGKANRFNFIEFHKNPKWSSDFRRSKAIDMSTETSVKESFKRIRDEDMIDYLDLYGEAMDNTMVFDKKTKEWIYKPIQPGDIDLDHKFTLVQSMGMYHNVSFGSPLWNQIQEIALRRGYRPGNTRKNLGLVDPETHRVKSKFFNDLHGKDSTGLKYWKGEHRNTGKTRLELMEQSHKGGEAEAIHLEIVEDYFNEIDTGSRILDNALAYWNSKSTRNITTDQMVDELSKIVWEDKTLRTYLPSEVRAAIDAVEKNFTNPTRAKEEWSFLFGDVAQNKLKVIEKFSKKDRALEMLLDRAGIYADKNGNTVLGKPKTSAEVKAKYFPKVPKEESDITMKQLKLVIEEVQANSKIKENLIELLKVRRGKSLRFIDELGMRPDD